MSMADGILLSLAIALPMKKQPYFCRGANSNRADAAKMAESFEACGFKTLT
jgi:hypothetical protein